jgi:hypothetical protein
MAVASVGASAGLSKAVIDTQIQQDALYVRQFYDWAKHKYSVYNGNITPNVSTYYPQSGDQSVVTTFSANLNRLINIFEGGTQATGENIVNDLAGVLGVI